MKGGQITIFIIIAIVIVAVVILFFVFSDIRIKTFLNLASQEEIFLGQQSEIVSSIVDQCLFDSIQTTSYINAFNGGYFFPSGTQGDYFINNIINYPSKKELENQFSLGIKNLLQSCLNFSYLQSNVEYTFKNEEVKITFYEDYLEASLSLPITISINDSYIRLKSFTSKVPTDYFQFYSLAVELTDEQSKHPNEVCITCMGALSESKDIFVSGEEMVNEENYLILYTLSKVDEQNQTTMMYSFLHKFNLP